MLHDTARRLPHQSDAGRFRSVTVKEEKVSRATRLCRHTKASVRKAHVARDVLCIARLADVEALIEPCRGGVGTPALE